MNSKTVAIIEKVIKMIKRFIDISNLTADDLDELISDTILSLIIAYRKYKTISPKLELKVVKGAVCYFLRKLKIERALKEKLRKEVMRFLRLKGLDSFIENDKTSGSADNKEERENGC